MCTEDGNTGLSQTLNLWWARRNMVSFPLMSFSPIFLNFSSFSFSIWSTGWAACPPGKVLSMLLWRQVKHGQECSLVLDIVFALEYLCVLDHLFALNTIQVKSQGKIGSDHSIIIYVCDLSPFGKYLCASNSRMSNELTQDCRLMMSAGLYLILSLN